MIDISIWPRCWALNSKSCRIKGEECKVDKITSVTEVVGAFTHDFVYYSMPLVLELLEGVVSTRHFKIHEGVISLSLRLLKTCRNHTFVLCSASFGCKSSLGCELNVTHPLAASDPLLKGFLQFHICGCPSFVFQKSSVFIA